MSELEVSPDDGALLNWGVPGLPDTEDIIPSERAYWAQRLRNVGYEWAQIAWRVGYGSRGACIMEVRTYLQRAALEMEAEQRSEALAMELNRLDELQTPYYIAAISGDLKSAEFVLKVMSQRAKLMRWEDTSADSGGTKTLIITPENYQTELRRLVEGEVVDNGDE